MRNAEQEAPLECLSRDTQAYRSFATRSPSPYICNAGGIYTSVRILPPELPESARSQVTERSTINLRRRCLCFPISPRPSFPWGHESENSLQPRGRFCEEQNAQMQITPFFLFWRRRKKIQPSCEQRNLEEAALLQKSPPNLFKCLLWKSPGKGGLFFFNLEFSSQWSLQS